MDGQLENRSVADIVELPVGWLYWIMAWPIRIEQRSWLDGQASDDIMPFITLAYALEEHPHQYQYGIL